MIDDKTLAFYGSGGGGDPSVGGFTWSGHFTWESIPEQVKHHTGGRVFLWIKLNLTNILGHFMGGGEAILSIL